MSRLLILCSFITLILLCGCATTPDYSYKEGDYRLISLGESGRPFNHTVVLKLSESSLALAGVKNSWVAPISKNEIGELSPVKRSESPQVGAIEAMFINTIEGAAINGTEQGLLTFNRNGKVVALFEPIE